MYRLYLFIGSLNWGPRLQMLALALILGSYAWFDFVTGRFPVTVGIIVSTWLLGWMLKPVMIRYPNQTQKIWGAFGIIILGMYIFAQNQWWWRLLIAHFIREFLLWLDLSCAYWFISEIRIQQQHLIDEIASPTAERERAADQTREKSGNDDWK